MIKNYFFVLVVLLSFGGMIFSQTPVVTVTGPTDICWNQTAQGSFSASATNNPLTYYWDVFPNMPGVVISSPTSSVTSISFPNTDEIYGIMCQSSNNFGYGQAQWVYVNVRSQPQVSFSGNTFFCQGSGTNLSASPTISGYWDSIQYSWYPPTGLNTTNGPYVTANPAQTTTYIVNVTNGPCPTFTTQVVVNPRMVSFSFSGSNYICQGHSTNISASGNLSGSSTLSYNWFPAAGLNTTTGQNVAAGPSITTMYTVIATDGICTATNVVNINVDECVGIADYSKGYERNFQFYPNPNKGRFLIVPGETTQASLMNEIGQTIRQLEFTKDESMEITGLDKGIYFLVTPRSTMKIVVLR